MSPPDRSERTAISLIMSIPIETQNEEILPRREELLLIETSPKEATNVNNSFASMVTEILTIHAGLEPMDMESIQTTITPIETIIQRVKKFNRC
jgi:hypothetical protein